MFEAHIDECHPSSRGSCSVADLLLFVASSSGLTYDGTETGMPLYQRTWETSDTSLVHPWLESLFTPFVHWRYEMEKQSRLGAILTPFEVPTVAGTKRRKLGEAGLSDEDALSFSTQSSTSSSDTAALPIDPLWLRGTHRMADVMTAARSGSSSNLWTQTPVGCPDTCAVA